MVMELRSCPPWRNSCPALASGQPRPTRPEASRAADAAKEGDSLPTRKSDPWLRGRPPAGSAHLGALAALLPPPGRARPGTEAHSAPSRPGERAARPLCARSPQPAPPALRRCRRRGPLPAWPRPLARQACAGQTKPPSLVGLLAWSMLSLRRV